MESLYLLEFPQKIFRTKHKKITQTSKQKPSEALARLIQKNGNSKALQSVYDRPLCTIPMICAKQPGVKTNNEGIWWLLP